MIRVAALMDTVTVSGPGRQLAAIAAPLETEGVSLHVLAFHPAAEPDTPFMRHLRAQGVPHTPVPAYGRLRLRTMRALDAAFDAVEPDIIQTHSYRPNAHVLLSRLRGRRHEPWVAFFHGTTAENRLVEFYHALDRFMLAQADAVCVVAETQRAQVTRARSVTVIPNAVLIPDEAPSPAGRRDDDETVLFVGRLSREKGVDVLLSAWPRVVAEQPTAHLVIVGDGPERARLEAQVSAAGVRESVTFTGHQADPWPYYAQASLVVLPSRSEGMPNVLLEAMARDLPVVATRAGGIPLVLGEPPAGRLVPVGDADALQAAIVETLRAPDDALMRDRRAGVRDRHSLGARAVALVQRYRTLLR